MIFFIIISIIISIILFIVYCIMFNFNKMSISVINRIEDQKIRYKLYYNITNKWLENKNFNKLITNYLIDRNIGSVAIYGIGELGERLYEELKDSKVQVSYFIDRSAEENDYVLDGIPLINLDSIKSKDKVDLIIITPIYAFNSIEKSLKAVGIHENKIIGLDEIINEI